MAFQNSQSRQRVFGGVRIGDQVDGPGGLSSTGAADGSRATIMNQANPGQDDAHLDLLIRLGAPQCVDPTALDVAELIALAQSPLTVVADPIARHLAVCTHCTAL